MTTTSPSATGATGALPRAAAPASGRRVVDAPTRMFHWLFALTFAGATLTADSEHWRLWHVTLGYAFGGLVAFRLLYGLFGPRPARLGALWRRVAGLPRWLRSLAPGRAAGAADRRQWQNLAMAIAILVMITLAAPLVLSGYGIEQDGLGALNGESLEDLHAFLGDAFLAVVAVHVALIATLSVLRRRNQAAPMLTGRASGPGPDLVRDDRGWPAGLLLVAVVSFAAWQGFDAAGRGGAALDAVDAPGPCNGGVEHRAAGAAGDTHAAHDAGESDDD